MAGVEIVRKAVQQVPTTRHIIFTEAQAALNCANALPTTLVYDSSRELSRIRPGSIMQLTRYAGEIDR